MSVTFVPRVETMRLAPRGSNTGSTPDHVSGTNNYDTSSSDTISNYSITSSTNNYDTEQ